MDLTKIIFVVTLIAFCCVNLSSTLRCFVCNSQQTCKHAQLYECNPHLANDTQSYLQQFHYGVNTNATTSNFECFQEYLKTTTNNEIYYKGCTYSTIAGCKLPLKVTGFQKQYCKQCSGKDGCNPAGRINIDVITVFVTIIVGVFLRY